jgi:hypothetical protein
MHQALIGQHVMHRIHQALIGHQVHQDLIGQHVMYQAPIGQRQVQRHTRGQSSAVRMVSSRQKSSADFVFAVIQGQMTHKVPVIAASLIDIRLDLCNFAAMVNACLLKSLLVIGASEVTSM